MPTEEHAVSNALVPLYSGPFFVYDRDAIVSSGPPSIEAPPARNPSKIEEEEDIEEVNLNGEGSVDVTVLMAMTTLWFWW